MNTAAFATPTDAPYQVLSDDLIEQAAHWHAVMQSGEISHSEQQAFNTWYDSSENSVAYQQMAFMWQQVDDVELASAKNTLEIVLNEQQQHKQDARKKTVATFASITALAIGLSAGSYYLPADNRLISYFSSGYIFADHNTAIGESRVITLTDNTHVHLNSFSAINVRYSNKQRTIELLQGEIHLDVAKDASRPLRVTTEQGTARALGTQFIVRQRDNITDVTVIESRVEVCTRHNSKAAMSNSLNRNKVNQVNTCQQLQAGQQTYINNDKVLPPQASSTQFKHDWSQQLLIVESQPVLKVLDELAQYHSGYLKIDRSSLAKCVVSGVFPLNDLTKSLQVLEGSLALNVNRYTSLLTVIKAAPNDSCSG